MYSVATVAHDITHLGLARVACFAELLFSAMRSDHIMLTPQRLLFRFLHQLSESALMVLGVSSTQDGTPCNQ